MKRHKRIRISKISVFIYWLIFLLLLGLFFTNDFGIVDIHKTSIITAVGIDTKDNEVLVTAEIAVPQPSQSGENIKYTQVQGSGLTIADALNEINSKTGFYPKLQFCKLILIGEHSTERNLFALLGCFYRKNYSELTALTAVCEGKASDMLALKSETSSMTSEAIRKVLSDEIEKSANANSSNLKTIAEMQYSKSKACYMPYVEISKPGTSENGGDGDNVGGEDVDSEKSGSSQGSSQSGGGSGGGEGEGSSGGSGKEEGGEQTVEFTARKTAVFRDGYFAEILDEQQSFALAVLRGEIRLAVLPCDAEGVHYTLGLKNVKGGTKLKVKDGVPYLTVSFSAYAQIQGARERMEPEKIMHDNIVAKPVLKGAEEALKERFEKLFKTIKETDIDIVKARTQLYKNNNKYFEAFSEDLLQRMKIKYEIKINSMT